MRIAIIGAGNVGRAIAQDLITNGHQVLLIEKDPRAVNPDLVPAANWLQADACELSSLEEAQFERYDVAIAATGDDKVNLVHSMLAKTEFGVPRTVSRVNQPDNEWMFDEVWGVDFAVSTPSLIAALVEEAVSVGDLVRLMSFKRTGTSLTELTLPADSPLVGRAVTALELPQGAVLTAIIRLGQPFAPGPEQVLESGDELLFILTRQAEAQLAGLFDPAFIPSSSED